jgi:hypothetical protein
LQACGWCVFRDDRPALGPPTPYADAARMRTHRGNIHVVERVEHVPGFGHAVARDAVQGEQATAGIALDVLNGPRVPAYVDPRTC